MLVFTGLSIFAIYSNSSLYIIPFLLMLLPVYLHDKVNTNYLRGILRVETKKNDNLYYLSFVKKLKEANIDNKKTIQMYIDILELEDSYSDLYRMRSDFFLSTSYIPALMIYFATEFEKATVIAYLTIGLVLSPIVFFLFKVLVNRKRINRDKVLRFLIMRSIELSYS
jgi:hypothetical protein